jgi:Antibiotic biosynthesis monooxygenase
MIAFGRRDEFLAILLEGTAAMPGCLSYIAARDPSDPDAIWITEVWDSKESQGAAAAGRAGRHRPRPSAHRGHRQQRRDRAGRRRGTSFAGLNIPRIVGRLRWV